MEGFYNVMEEHQVLSGVPGSLPPDAALILVKEDQTIDKFQPLTPITLRASHYKDCKASYYRRLSHGRQTDGRGALINVRSIA